MNKPVSTIRRLVGKRRSGENSPGFWLCAVSIAQTAKESR